MNKKLYKMAGALAILITAFALVRVYVVPILYHPKVYRFSDPEIRALEKSIQSDPAWQCFLRLFPNSALPFILPTYYQAGSSKPLFLVERNISIPSEYAMSLWLFAYVHTTESGVSFTNCKLRVDYMQDRQIVASYTLSTDDTYRAFALSGQDEIISYIMKIAYPQ